MTHQSHRFLIGIDVGGTFTDAVVTSALDGAILDAFKLPSTPLDPSVAVIEAFHRIHRTYPLNEAMVCHGTTIGTNLLIQHRGAKTALLATKGFTDVIELRRQNRPTLYDLNVKISPPLVDTDMRFAVSERCDARGRVLENLSNVDQLVSQVMASGAQAVAIALLHAYANDTHEKILAQALRQACPDLFISVSSDVCPEIKEYERTSTAVVNAYIGPGVQSYIDKIALEAQRLGLGALMIVKSNGGLTSTENASRYPVHLIESGPAAGIISTLAHAKEMWRDNVIAFDMGGTTAKVGVIQGGRAKVVDEFLADQLVDGANVGGYPIRSAVLDIVEIGAGGGSIAWIDDGGVLKVGPESAGAAPGPACYGLGGQRPTVTDAHAVIGTLSQEAFKDSGVAFSRDLAVKAIETHIAQPMGWSLARAAHAIIEIAVANMTEMVRISTVRRGLDPREFSIFASGGAGPLHACAIGLQAGAKEVIIPPLPGMFSALGATMGEIRHDLSQTLLVPVAQLDPQALAKVCNALGKRARSLMANEPVDPHTVMSERSADLRFVGQLFELNIGLGPASEALPDCDEIEARFRAVYQHAFGIDLPNLKVQLVNVRWTAMAVLRESRQTKHTSGVSLQDVPPHRLQNYLSADGSQTSLPVHRLIDCRGAQLSGPALIEHAGSTVWIDSAQTITIHANGSMQIALDAAPPSQPTAPAATSLLAADPVTFEVVKSGFYAICDEMKSVIMRTSFSPLLSLSADLSCVLLDTQARVIAQGVDIPVHLGAASFTGRFALEAFALATWHEGDAVILNDPYAGGTHLPDVSLLTPIFFAKRLMGFVLSRIHWPDIGGIAPGSSSVCDEIIKEGLRIPPLKIIEQGVVREDVLRLILANVRVPQDRMGDFQAARAGHQRATERMIELCHRYGGETIDTVMRDTLEYSQKRVAAQLLNLPDVDVSNEEPLDGDGIDPQAAPIIKVRITKTGAHLKFDFTGSAPCVRGPINAPLPVTCAAIYYTLLSFVGGQIAPNAGVYANVEVITEPGTIVHASYPFPVVAANTETANRLVDILMGALAKAYPEKVSAGGYGSACVYTLGGTDPSTQKSFVHYETIGGGMGGTASNAGPSGLRVHMGNTMNLPIEGVEAALPVLFHEYAIARHLAGQGKYPGGGGVRKVIEVLTDGVQTSVLGERTITPARGVAGGGDGGLASFTLVSEGVDHPLDSKSGPHRLKRGDKLVMVTAGGGAWGPSTQRKS